jgi:hypothetical protein
MCVAVALLLMPLTGIAEDGGPSIKGVTVSGVALLFDGQDMIVFDGQTRTLLFYRTQRGGGLDLRGGARLEDDRQALAEMIEKQERAASEGAEGEAAGQARRGSGIPARDVPGQDPSGFERPQGWVRVGSSWQPETTSARYYAAAPVPEVFPDLREAVERSGFEITEWTVHLDAGDVEAVSGDRRLMASLMHWHGPEGTRIVVRIGERED